jgi:hypothetical protein
MNEWNDALLCTLYYTGTLVKFYFNELLSDLNLILNQIDSLKWKSITIISYYSYFPLKIPIVFLRMIMIF